MCKPKPQSPRWSLSEVRELIGRRRVRPKREILDPAFGEFGLDLDGICRVIERLKPEEFHDRVESKYYPGLEFDEYHHVLRMPGHPSVKLYIKFAIEDEPEIRLFIASFKPK